MNTVYNEEIKKQLCQRCDIKPLCIRGNSVETLFPLCLDRLADEEIKIVEGTE